jgi:hypothetical protein
LRLEQETRVQTRLENIVWNGVADELVLIGVVAQSGHPHGRPQPSRNSLEGIMIRQSGLIIAAAVGCIISVALLCGTPLAAKAFQSSLSTRLEPVFVAQSAWSQRADQLDPAAAAQYAIADGDIVYYQRNGLLIAFDAVTRRTRWKERQPWLFTASEGVVFTSTKTGRIAARRASDRR